MDLKLERDPFQLWFKVYSLCCSLGSKDLRGVEDVPLESFEGFGALEVWSSRVQDVKPQTRKQKALNRLGFGV